MTIRQQPMKSKALYIYTYASYRNIGNPESNIAKLTRAQVLIQMMLISQTTI